MRFFLSIEPRVFAGAFLFTSIYRIFDRAATLLPHIIIQEEKYYLFLKGVAGALRAFPGPLPILWYEFQ